MDREKERVSLGLKQMTDNPWADIERKYPINSHVKGRVTKLLPYGAFVELEKGVEGLVHVSELSWVKRITRPSDVLKLDQEIEAVVLSISDRFKVGDMVTGQVAKIASFGAFVNLNGDIDGLIHISQLSEDHVERVKDVIKVGDEITARVIKVDSIERRIGLSIKAVNYDTEQLRRETASFEALRPSSDMVGLEHAFNLATRENEEWSPSEEK